MTDLKELETSGKAGGLNGAPLKAAGAWHCSRSSELVLGLAQELIGILLLAPRPAGETRATSYTRGGM